MPFQVDNFDHTATMIASGAEHTLILTDQGHVYGMGQNRQGQLGVETQHTSSITPVRVDDISHIPMRYIAAGSFSASIATETGSLYLWGTGTFGSFKTPHRVKKIKQKALRVDIGDTFGAVLTEERDMYTWGINSQGQLGSGDFEDRPTP